jgi:hypothetical protein
MPPNLMARLHRVIYYPLQTATVYQIKSAQPIFAQQDDETLKVPLADIVTRISGIIEEFGALLHSASITVR